MKVISKNAIRCKHCGDVIESKSVHDFKYCSCKSCFVDGGHNYLRRGFMTSPENDYEDLSEYDEIPSYHVEYISKYLPDIHPYETDLPKDLDYIIRKFETDYLRITDEDGTVIYDTLTDKEMSYYNETEALYGNRKSPD